MAGLEDANKTTDLDQTVTVIEGKDLLGTTRQVNTIVLPTGYVGIPTQGEVVVTSTFGYDQQPDSHFNIIKTGAAGDTWTVYIAGTNNDPTTPDRDLPSYSKVFTVQAGEVGDEIKLRDRMITELNNDSTFRATCFLRALKHTDRATVVISSDKLSATGEFYERPNSGDFAVTVTGTAQVVVVYDNLISRSKPITITRDTDTPGRLGLFGITGAVNITAKALSDLYFAEATNATYGTDLRQNGSLESPVIFTIPAYSKQVYVEDLWFSANANGIKFGQFLAKNSKLTNGVKIIIKSDNIMTTFPLIYSTEDFKNRWAALSGTGSNFFVNVQAGSDEMIAILSLPNPFLMRESGAFGTGNDDYINIYIQDDIRTGSARFDFAVKGFEKEP